MISDRTGTASGRSTDGGQDVLFEETLSIQDEEGARSHIRFTRVAVLLLVVFTLASMVLLMRSAAATFVSAVGGTDVALSILDDIRSEQPLEFGILLLVGLLIVAFSVFLIGGFMLQMRRAFDEQTHVRVTDTGVTVRREGGRYWQSSGVDVPFDAITSVEYVDPDQSSIRVRPGDWRAQKFFAGRSRNWVRIERDDDSAVYVGSDRPLALAETIVRGAPRVETAEPF